MGGIFTQKAAEQPWLELLWQPRAAEVPPRHKEEIKAERLHQARRLLERMGRAQGKHSWMPDKEMQRPSG